MTKILVTGGAGFVGRHLIGEMVNQDYSIKVIDSGETGRINDVPEACEILVQDISKLSLDDWLFELSGVETVFHLAARKYNTPGVTADSLVEANALATLRLAEASSIIGVKRFVYASSLYAYGHLGPEAMDEERIPTPTTVYGNSKLFGEYALRTKDFAQKLNWVTARFFFVYGTGQFTEGGYKSVINSNFERIAKGENPVIRGDGKQALDYINVADVIDALMLMSKSDQQGVFNVGSGSGVSINDLTSLMLETARSDLKPIYAESDWTSGTSRVSNTSKIKENLGWYPKVPLKQGLEQVWSEFQSKGA
jgi:UDP-glucose 4-epimerase